MGSQCINLQRRQEPQNQWLVTEFRLAEEEIDNIITKWIDEWKEPVVDDQFSIKVDPRKEGTCGTQPGGPQEEENPRSSQHGSD